MYSQLLGTERRRELVAAQVSCGDGGLELAADGGYFGLLSAESVRTLELQGGPMGADEAAAFEALPHARGAVAVRRWDDKAKDPGVTPPGFAHFVPLLQALVRS